MLVGLTGVSGVSYSVPAAASSFFAPLFVHHIPYPIRLTINTVLSVMSLLICTFGPSFAGPVAGNMLAGIAYGFGSNLYLAAAAFYDQRTVISFSIGASTSFSLLTL
jgi:hypothetical protein